jgi:hypothetical protein
MDSEEKGEGRSGRWSAARGVAGAGRNRPATEATAKGIGMGEDLISSHLISWSGEWRWIDEVSWDLGKIDFTLESTLH